MSRALRLLSVATRFAVTSGLLAGLAGVCPSVAAPHPPRLPAKTAPNAQYPTSNTLLAITAEPAAIQLVGPRSQAHVLVTARYADGSLRDVTDKATVTPKNFGFVALESDGLLHPRRDGETFLACAFGGKPQASRSASKTRKRLCPSALPMKLSRSSRG